MNGEILTWNVNGMNSPNKRKIITHWLKKQKAEVICLQKVHIRKSDEKYLINRKLGTEFTSLSDKKVKGVIFYINKDIHPNKVFADNDGRYLAVEIDFNRKKTLLVGVYVPNTPKDLRNLQRKLMT